MQQTELRADADAGRWSQFGLPSCWMTTGTHCHNLLE
jgi:hypothetical protein